MNTELNDVFLAYETALLAYADRPRGYGIVALSSKTKLHSELALARKRLLELLHHTRRK